MKRHKKEKSISLTENMMEIKKLRQNCSHGVKQGLVLPLLLGLMLGDMATIYPLMDAICYQNAILSLAITLIFGLALEGIPYAAAHFILKERKGKRDVIALTALGIIFLLAFFLLFFLRVNSQELQYQAAGAELSVSGMFEEEIETVFSPTKAQKSMTLLLGFMPLITSVFALVLGCAYSPKELRRERDELAEIELSKLLADVKASSKEIEKEWERDLTAYDDALFQSRQADLDNFAEMEKYEVRKMLAIKLGTPDAVSRLLERSE